MGRIAATAERARNAATVSATTEGRKTTVDSLDRAIDLLRQHDESLAQEEATLEYGPERARIFTLRLSIAYSIGVLQAQRKIDAATAVVVQ